MKTVEFDMDICVDTTPIRGNAVSSNDAVCDRECEDAIIAELNDGNDWAWGSVRMIASIGRTSRADFLGCVSYASEDAFKDTEYYLDMKGNALSDLRTELEDCLDGIRNAEYALAKEREAYRDRLVDTDSNSQEDVTEVVFLRENNSDDIFAAFPGQEEFNDHIGSYAHVGQHSAASLAYCAECDEVTDPGDYADLAGELFRIGYKLRVVSKVSIKSDSEADTWACTSCAYSVHVHQYEYDSIGTPYCSDCDQEMECV